MVMGIVNATPDSFSDGGKYLNPSDALAHALEMVDLGADIIDVGGESTRPGSQPVSIDDELDRVIPVVSELSSASDIPISIDTRHAEVAEAAIDAGASIINDIMGLRGKGMMDVAVSSQVPAIVMFMHGTPETLATDTVEGDVLEVVRNFFEERIETALDAGMHKNNIILDPGIGFGVTHQQSIQLLENCTSLVRGYPVLVGASRKRFLAEMFPGMDREQASVEAVKVAAKAGADIVRVHDVAMTLDALLD